MKEILSIQEFQRMTNEYDKVKFRCRHCGRRVVIPAWVDKQLCSWCNHYVYRNPQEEFKDNIKKLMK